MTTMANDVEVRVFWPEGGSTLWRTGTPLVGEDGVGPLTPRLLNDTLLMWMRAGVVAPLDDECLHFAALTSDAQPGQPRGHLADCARLS